MPDITPGGAAPAGEQKLDMTKFDKFFGPAPTPQEAVNAEPPKETPPPVEAQGSAPAVPAETKTEEAPKAEETKSLSDAIREAREARAARQAEADAKARQAKEQADYKAKYEALAKADLVTDPRAWAEAQGMSPEDQITFAETLLYSLAPDKADANVKLRLLEAKHEREKRLAAEAEAKRKAEEERAAVARAHEEYVAGLISAAEKAKAGSYPLTEAWFAGDPEGYVNSLYAAANHLAEEASAQGKVADLSFEAVASKVESFFKERVTRVAPKGSPSQPEQKPVVKTEPATTQVAVSLPSIDSSRGLSGGGSPERPAETEAERLARAAAVVFRTR